MSLVRILKLKLCYIVNKSILISLFIMCFILVSAFLFEAINAIYETSYKEALDIYNTNSFTYLKIIMTFFSIYLFTYSIGNKNDFLIYLLMPLGVSKRKSIVSTILVNILIIFIIFLFLFFCYNSIALIFIPTYVFEFEYLMFFLNILLVSIIYGLYSMIFMFIFNSNFVIMITFALFIISNNYFESLTNTLSFFDYLTIYLLPNVNNNGEIYVTYLNLIFQQFLTTFILISLYSDKDLNF